MPKKPIRKPFYSQVHSSWAIPLTRGVIALVDKDIAETLGRFNWYANNLGGIRWYALRAGDRQNWNARILMHKAILSVEEDEDVDHREHYPMSDKLIDNRRTNLRPTSRMENMRNASIRLDNKSGFKGVTWDAARNRWAASLTINYKRISLGRFEDKLEAALAYDRAAIEWFGEHAKTNEQLGLISKTNLYCLAPTHSDGDC
jgi:hypothetical protein